jgi:hypothetical protein
MLIPLLVAVIVVSGYVTAFPIARRGLSDLGRIPGSVWRVTGYRNRKTWRNAICVSYCVAGWPSVLVVLRWRRSEQRVVLRDEWHLLIEERRARHEIVLAHYEDQPNEAETPG